MKNKGVLPDTCAWIEYFKSRTSSVGKKLEDLLRETEVYTCGAIMYELVQGLRSDEERAKVLKAFRALAYIEFSEPLWVRAGELASILRKEGKTIPFSDILIATIALEHNLSILTIDKHFEQIPGVQMVKS